MTTRTGWVDSLIGVTVHSALTGRDETGAHPADAVSTDAFTGHLTGAANVQEALDAVDGLALGGTGADVSLDDSAFDGNLVGVTDVQSMADVVDGLTSGWVSVTGYTTTPASAATITMTTDHTRWIRVGDAIRWQSSVPFVENNTLAE